MKGHNKQNTLTVQRGDTLVPVGAVGEGAGPARPLANYWSQSVLQDQTQALNDISRRHSISLIPLGTKDGIPETNKSLQISENNPDNVFLECQPKNGTGTPSTNSASIKVLTLSTSPTSSWATNERDLSAISRRLSNIENIDLTWDDETGKSAHRQNQQEKKKRKFDETANGLKGDENSQSSEKPALAEKFRKLLNSLVHVSKSIVEEVDENSNTKKTIKTKAHEIASIVSQMNTASMQELLSGIGQVEKVVIVKTQDSTKYIASSCSTQTPASEVEWSIEAHTQEIREKLSKCSDTESLLSIIEDKWPESAYVSTKVINQRDLKDKNTAVVIQTKLEPSDSKRVGRILQPQLRNAIEKGCLGAGKVLVSVKKSSLETDSAVTEEKELHHFAIGIKPEEDKKCMIEQLMQGIKKTRERAEVKLGYSVFIFGLLSNITLLVAIYVISDLSAEDKISVWRGASLFFLGIAFFTSMYSFFVHLMQRTPRGQIIIKKYRLNTSDVLDISNKIVSSIQALFSCLTGWTICTYSCNKNLLRTSHYISHAYSWFGASYFFYDIWSMYKVHVNTPPGQINTPSATMNTPIPPPHVDEAPRSELRRFLRYLKLNPIIVGHHLFIGLFGFSVIIYLKGNLGDCVFGFVFLMEASTPFVSLRSVLSRFQLKTSKLYIYNGFTMLVVFFLCRVAMFPYVMKLYANAANLDFFVAVGSLPTGCKVSIAVLTLPQLYWFYLMIKGATKILIEPRSKTTTPATETHKFHKSLLPEVVEAEKDELNTS